MIGTTEKPKRFTVDDLVEMSENRAGMYAVSDRLTAYNFLLGGEIIRAINICGSYSRAFTALGLSTATGSKWRTWGKAGEEPFKTFVAICDQAVADFRERRSREIDEKLEAACGRIRSWRTGQQ